MCSSNDGESFQWPMKSPLGRTHVRYKRLNQLKVFLNPFSNCAITPRAAGFGVVFPLGKANFAILSKRLWRFGANACSWTEQTVLRATVDFAGNGPRSRSVYWCSWERSSVAFGCFRNKLIQQLIGPKTRKRSGLFLVGINTSGCGEVIRQTRLTWVCHPFLHRNFKVKLTLTTTSPRIQNADRGFDCWNSGGGDRHGTAR